MSFFSVDQFLAKENIQGLIDMINLDLKNFFVIARYWHFKFLKKFIESTDIVIDVPHSWISTESICEFNLTYFTVWRNVEFDVKNLFDKM